MRIALTLFLFAAFVIPVNAQSVDMSIAQADAERSVSVNVGESFQCDEALAVISLEGARESEEGTIFAFSILFDDGQIFHAKQIEGCPVKLVNKSRPVVYVVPVRAQGGSACRTVVKFAKEDRSRVYRNRIAASGDSVDLALQAADNAFMLWAVRFPACQFEPEFTPEARKKWRNDGIPQAIWRGLSRWFR